MKKTLQSSSLKKIAPFSEKQIQKQIESQSINHPNFIPTSNIGLISICYFLYCR